MKEYARQVTSLVFVPVLTLTLMCSLSHAQSTSLSGSFGFLLNASYPDPSSNNGSALLGVMNFDDTGTVTGSLLGVSGAIPDRPARTTAANLTGTYSTDPDGTGSMTINIGPGLDITLAIVITDGGKGLLLAATNCTFPCARTLFSGVARAVYTGPLRGTYGFQLNASPQGAGAFIGVINFDGAGNATASSTITSDGGSSGQPSVAKGTLTGTYSTNADGTGTITFPAQGDRSAISDAFVITDGGSEILLVITNFPAGVPFGAGRLQ